MRNPKISVIVPIYNTEDFLIRCLTSITRQSYVNLEILLVNDGSTDDSQRICEEFAKQDERIKILTKPNGGVSSARNAALEIATGEYVGFVDSDDYISFDMFEKLILAILSTEADVAECGYTRVDRYGKEAYKYNLMNETTEGNYSCSKKYARKENTYHINCNKLYRSEILSHVRYTELRYSEDYLFNIHAYYFCEKKVSIDSSCYFYVENDDSATGKSFAFARFDAIKAGELAYRFYDRLFPDLRDYALLYIIDTSRILYMDLKNSNVLDRKRNENYLVTLFKDNYRTIKRKIPFIVDSNKTRIALWLFKTNPSLYYHIKQIRGYILN